MLARAFGFLGKAWKRTPNMSVEASTSPRRFHMTQQLCHLHSSRTSQPEKLRKEQHPLQNNSGGALSMLDYISKQDWSKQNNNVNSDNSAFVAVDSIRDTVDGSFDQRFATLKSIGEDRVNDRELKLLLKKKPAPNCYVWFDPSPYMHISQGIMKTLIINKMVKSGFKVKILMADWFAQMNSEISGNLNKMRTVGRYNIEMWKATGMALDEVELVWLSDEISQHGDEYWPLVMDIARQNSVRKIRRSFHITLPSRFCGSRNPYSMGELTIDDIFFICLQCAGIIFEKADIWLLGMEQHDANLLARQYCKHVKRKSRPIAVLQNMLPNLLQCPEMENRRHPAWAIFMEDDEENICYKIEKAFCPPKLAEGNSCLEYIKHIILPWFGKFEVVQKKENGGKKIFLSMEEFTADYESGTLHPVDVKLALEKSLNKILQPVRDHFGRNGEAKDLMKAIRECCVADWD
ncbi:tyrosine--tRNA ligase 1, cytoplasmic-like isoform X2 [Oryza brachyantha]|uniref:tyrosine--tRNA ligase 1, cytoplasmic-like isoform X2 n=1 Tax=Oryza brachyantha TaxID=4533 RepID=UPI0007767C09|nr:tyrosine--tRNA ligase 1, cytoplasmic-like isoform X2 [Oryza brachyantha]